MGIIMWRRKGTLERVKAEARGQRIKMRIV